VKAIDYFCERDPDAFPLWQKATVGIAGAGGLGSNCAIMLARAGIGKLIVADFDKVSLSNLNRQSFNIDQVGMPKTDALKMNIRMINPFIQLQMHDLRLTPNNIPSLFKDVDVMIEAFDKDSQKLMLIETWFKHHPKIPLICASGLAGYGRSEEIKIQHEGSFYIVGDQSSRLKDGISPIAPRVMIVAAMQANLSLEIIAGKDK
jgi:sulfur carrier protein ThiS adenylyltransferase